MTDAERQALAARMAAVRKPAPAGGDRAVQAPPASSPQSPPGRLDPLRPPDQAERLASLVTPEGRAALEPLLEGRPTQAGAKMLADSETATREVEAASRSKLPQGPPNPNQSQDEFTLGDVMDLDPEMAKAAGFARTAETIAKYRNVAGGPVGGPSSPFASEWGQQQLKDLRSVPLERMTGQLGMSPGAMEEELANLYF